MVAALPSHTIHSWGPALVLSRFSKEVAHVGYLLYLFGPAIASASAVGGAAFVLSSELQFIAPLRTMPKPVVDLRVPISSERPASAQLPMR